MRAAVVALALLTGGCTVGDTEEPDGRPRRDIAARPESLPPLPATPAASASGSARGSASASASTSMRPGASGSVAPSASGPAGRPGVSSAPPGAPGSTAPAAPFRSVGTTTDRERDAGTGTPGYGDLTAVTIEDDGTSARVTVRLAASIPVPLSSEESMGIGVDFYRTPLQTESDYQLFADGQPDGWYAYLHTPKGFAKYQGTFGIGGDRLVFTVPWSALGGRTAGNFSAFADWTRRASPLNEAGEDRAPGLGNAAYER